MASAAAKLGFKCVAYLNTGTFGTPTWTAVLCMSDWKSNFKWDQGDAATRESRLKLTLKTMADLEITGKLRNSNSGDTSYTTIAAAALTDNTLDMMILNGTNTTNGVSGFRCSFQLYDNSQDQGLAAVLFDEVMLKPAPNTDSNFSSVLVATGAAAFTAI